jgi:hypothetical protein
MRQIFGDIGWEKKIAIFFSMTLLLALIGPFGTYDDLDFWERSVFWVMCVGGVGFCMHVTVVVALNTAALGQLKKLFRVFIGAIFGAFPGAAVVIFIDAVLRPPLINADDFPTIWLQIAVLGLLICPIEYLDWRRLGDGSVENAPIRTKLHDRLRSGTTDEIISMSMQDHYVEVSSAQGKELVLMRFADAIEEIEGIPGVRIHRSHWIADTHLKKIEKRGHRTFATVSDGSELPVSDTYSEVARARLASAEVEES